MLEFRRFSKSLIEILVITEGGSPNHIANLKNYQASPEWFLVNIHGVIKTSELRQIADKIDELNNTKEK